MTICLIKNNRFRNVEHIYSFVHSLIIHAFILHFFACLHLNNIVVEKIFKNCKIIKRKKNKNYVLKVWSA